MLLFLPLAAFMGLFLTLGNIYSAKGWRRAYLRAAILWGSYLILLTEALSLAESITPLGLALGWLLLALVTIGLLFYRVRSGQPILLPRWRQPEGWFDRVLILGVLVIIGLTAFLAWMAPPQTWDSLNYHLARVAHWAQQKAVRHYVTGVEVQNSMPPGAEMAVLHVYVLSASDRLTTFVQWSAMVGSIVGVSLLAAQLGVGSLGLLVTTIFATTIPMGIVQASSTVTDYLVAFWMVCVASESLSFLKREGGRSSALFASLAAGLGLVTKPTALAYVFPFAVLMAVLLLRCWSLGKFLRFSVLAFALVFLLNLGHLARNTDLYGNPIASRARISAHVNEIMDIRVLLSNTLRNASLHAGTPSPHVNKAIYLFVAKVHEIIGLDLVDPRTTLGSRFKVPIPTTNEDRTTNPIHALLITIVFVVLLLKRREVNSTVLISGLVVASTFLLLSWLIKWEIFNSRLHLPFFVLFAPVVGYVLERFLLSRGVRLVGLVLLIASWPWLVGIQSRPLIENAKSYVRSVLVEPRWELYFANGGDLKQPYQEMTEMIEESGCLSVGILMPGNGAEYPLWALLGAPGSGPRIEWIEAGMTARFTDPNFQPCAVICQRCPEDQRYFRDLPLTYEHQPTDFRLFLGTTDDHVSP